MTHALRAFISLNPLLLILMLSSSCRTTREISTAANPVRTAIITAAAAELQVDKDSGNVTSILLGNTNMAARMIRGGGRTIGNPFAIRQVANGI